MQLARELRTVHRAIQQMERRVSQVLTVTRGTRRELELAVMSVRERLRTNPSLTEASSSQAALAAASAAVSEEAVHEKLRKRFEREPTTSELAVEVKLECTKERRRRDELNQPTVFALGELEETAALGAEKLHGHEATLTKHYAQLHDVLACLREHSVQHERVARPAADRAKVERLQAEATHEALAVAAECEDSCRNASGKALDASRKEKSQLEARKSDVQRAMLERAKTMADFKRRDKAGTSFLAWSKMELALKDEGGA